MFQSILAPETTDMVEVPAAPDFFVDLKLDYVIDIITADRQEYNLKPFFYAPLAEIDTIVYRQEVMKDLKSTGLFRNIEAFVAQMRNMHKYLNRAEKLYYKYEKEGWFLEGVNIYCGAINHLLDDLSRANVGSRGLLAFRDYLADYVGSQSFASLLADTEKLKASLSAVRYTLLLKDNWITVRNYESEIDYSDEVETIFSTFLKEPHKDYKAEFPDISPGMNHVEAHVLDYVVQHYNDVFTMLDHFCEIHSNYVNQMMVRFEREIQFYLAYLEYMETLKCAGLHFCYPQITDTDKEIYDYEGFDLALAHKLVTANSPIVCNDFYLTSKERIYVVSGPNQGGKTTFARTFGQLHYLAGLGYPVPGREARLFLFDKLFTHFEKEENIETLHGKLQDDLVRIHSILNQATSQSIIIMNEIFTSTTAEDALFLGKKILGKITELGALCVYVTFVDVLTSLNDTIVSMVSTIMPGNLNLRTYKIIRNAANGLAYALSIAEKHGLTYSRLQERLQL